MSDGGPPTGLRLGVVTPMANEERTAVRFVDAVLDECAGRGFGSVTFFAVLDRASRDGTRGLLEAHAQSRPELRVVWAPETRGVADAYVRGYREALQARCDWILEIDAGFSHDPGSIGPFFAAAAAGNDCVFGSRFGEGGRNDAAVARRAISRTGTVLTNLLLGTRLSDATSGFELFTRPSLELVLAKGIRSKGPFFQTEVKAYCRTLRSAEVPIRYAGGSHRVRTGALAESLLNLSRLFVRRLEGTL
jgi:dolichol-phosphate mannosyltransferase